jgi:hypothetical protein
VAPPVFKIGLAANIVAGGFDSLPPPPPFLTILLRFSSECHYSANRSALDNRPPCESPDSQLALCANRVAAVERSLYTRVFRSTRQPVKVRRSGARLSGAARRLRETSRRRHRLPSARSVVPIVPEQTRKTTGRRATSGRRES